MDRQALLRELLDELAAHSPAAAMRHMRHWPGGRLSLVHLNVLAILEPTARSDARPGRGAGRLAGQRHRHRRPHGAARPGRAPADDDDRRVVRVALTEEGASSSQGMAARAPGPPGAMLDDLTDEELAGFLLGSRAMRRARDASRQRAPGRRRGRTRPTPAPDPDATTQETTR